MELNFQVTSSCCDIVCVYCVYVVLCVPQCIEVLMCSSIVNSIVVRDIRVPVDTS